MKKNHRHNKPTTGGKFAVGCTKNNKLIGVALGGRPVARALCDGRTFEITRVCTDGTFNATSFLYDKMKKIALLMGYEKVITYTLVKESGASLRALSAVVEKRLKGRSWNCKSRPRKNQKVYGEDKLRWKLY